MNLTEVFRRPHWLIGIVAALGVFLVAALVLTYSADQSGVSGADTRIRFEGRASGPDLK